MDHTKEKEKLAEYSKTIETLKTEIVRQKEQFAAHMEKAAGDAKNKTTEAMERQEKHLKQEYDKKLKEELDKECKKQIDNYNNDVNQFTVSFALFATPLSAMFVYVAHQGTGTQQKP